MNGPLKMYQTRQIITHDTPTQVPTCMYKMKNLLSGHTIHTSNHTFPSENLDISEQNNQISKMSALQIQQENILKQLADLKQQMLALRQTLNISTTSHFSSNNSADFSNHKIESNADLVINVNPLNPPYSLLKLQNLWANIVQITIHTYVHSNITEIPSNTQEFMAQIKNNEINPALPQLLIRLIWKNVYNNIELKISSLNTPIQGEPNILRYLSRIGPSNWNYETFNDPNEIDAILDICYLLSRTRTKTERLSLLQTLNGKLGKSSWFSSRESIADIAASSIIKQVVNPTDVNVNLSKWLQRCEAL